MGNKGGRPSKLTPETSERLVCAIEAGTTYGQACMFAGLDYTTYRKYMRRGEAEAQRLCDGGNAEGTTAQRESPFLALWQAVQAAEGSLVVRLLTTIEAAAEKHWQAAAWKLERRFPREYGRRMLAVQHEDVDVSTMTDEELESYIGALESGAG